MYLLTMYSMYQSWVLIYSQSGSLLRGNFVELKKHYIAYSTCRICNTKKVLVAKALLPSSVHKIGMSKSILLLDRHLL